MNMTLRAFRLLLNATSVTSKKLPLRNQSSIVLTFFLLFVTLGSQSYAQSYAYSTNNGAWSNAATWNTLPVDGLSAVVSGGNTVSFGAGDSYTGSGPWGWGANGVGGLGVGGGVEYGPAGAGTLNITGGTLTTGGMWAGHGGTGTINLSGGTLNIGGQHMLFGWNTSSSLNVSGGTLNMTGSGNIFRFGNSGQSFMNITTNGVANLSGSGIDLLASSQINVNGGTLNLTNTTQANSIVNVTAGSQMVVRGGGTLNMQAGTQTMNTAESLWLGYGGTTGTLNLSGGTWQQNTYLRMGVFADGNGIINQTGGTFEMGGAFEAWGSSPSAYNLSGGTFRTTANGVAINSYSGGAMTFNITGSSGNVTIDTPYDFTAPNTSVFNNAAATLTKTGAGKLTVAGQLDIRNGAFSMSNGTLDTSTGTYIGTAGGTASGTMSGGTLKNGYLGGANFSVGYNGGTGTFTQSGGTNQVGSLANAVIGWNSGSVGTYTLDGGSFSAVSNNTHIGYMGGTGTVNVAGGSFAAHNLFVGGSGATSGTLNLNGGTLSLANADGFYVDSNGTLNLNSGGSLPAANIRVTSGGNLNFNGGTGNASLNIFAGGGAGATVELNGKTLGVDTWQNLIASGTNAVLKNSSATTASIANGNTIWIWDAGQNLTIDANAGALVIGSRITSSGQTTQTGIIKTGGGTLTLASEQNDYTGVTTITHGVVRISASNALGSTDGGTVVESGAQLRLFKNAAGASSFGNGEALTISGNGGSATGALRSGVTGEINTYQGKVTLAANATINAGGGTGLILDVASGDGVNLGSNTLTFVGAGTHAVNDGIVGTGGLIKEGAGTTTLAAANAYSGATTVNLGTLKVASGGSISSSSTTVNTGGTFDVGGTAGSVQVNSGGLLKGSGSVGAFTLASGGTLTPGNSPGTLTAASAIVLGGSTYNWEISALTGTAGTTWDLFSVTGLLNMSDVTSSNKWNLVVTGDSGFTGWTDTSSYSYVFAQAASVSGFSSTVGTDVTSLFNITTSGIASKPNASFNVNGDFKVLVGSGTDGNGNQITTLNLMAVPEPSAGSMMGLGLAGLVATRLLRRKNS
jgi:autotransporter-associated beta strand protein